MKTTNNDGLLSRLTRYAAMLACALVLVSCGGGGGSAGGSTGGDVDTETRASSIELTASTPELLSAGITGTESVITVLVKDSGNNVLSGVNVTLTADSGALTNTSRVTNSSGIVTEKLSIGGNPTSRTITVSASVSGVAARTVTVNVVGNKLTINAPSSVNRNVESKMTISLLNSDNTALAGRAVTFRSQQGNTLVTDVGHLSSPRNTDSNGQLVLSYTPTSAGTDTIVVSAAGETASQVIQVNSTNFFVNAVQTGTQDAISEGNIGECVQVRIHNDNGGVLQNGPVTLTTSRGAVYSDALCTIQTSPNMVNGEATRYVKSQYPGIATLTARFGTATVSGDIEFVAPLGATPNISLQATPAVIGVNTGGSTSQQSTIRATVRDATNNLVKNAPVTFTITGGAGSLSSPSSSIMTGSDGTASVNYVAGASTSPLNGIAVQGQIDGTAVSGTVNLTVAAQSVSITAGTGNRIFEHDPQTYRKDYVVFVTDASGHAIAGATVTPSVRADIFRKGYMLWDDDGGSWGTVTTFSCANEDANNNHTIDAGEDINANGMLEPQIPMSVSNASLTDQNGMTTVSLYYPRNRALWTTVSLTIRGTAAGTEDEYVTTFRLPALAADMTNRQTTPPMSPNPYGTGEEEETLRNGEETLRVGCASIL